MLKILKSKAKSVDSEKRFKTESKAKLKIKEMMREFREKNLFYAEHSKFATYVDPEYLSTFETELVNFSKKWIRSFDQNMSAEKEPADEGHGNTRGLHVMDTEQGAKDIGRDLLLNEDLMRVGGKIHDLGHTNYAHDGEHIISKYLSEHGICEIHHATLARLVMEEEQLHEKVLERLAQKKGRELTDREKKKYNTYKLIIADIAAAHNGEGADIKIVANPDKTERDIDREFIETFTKPGTDKKIISKTVEGAIVRFNDPIAYVFKDFRDGVIGKKVDVNDPEYEKIFIEMGIPKEKLDEWGKKPGKKDKIVRAGTYLLRDDLEKNSRGKNGAQMSEELAKLMYKLRDLNYDKVIKPRTRKIIDVIGRNTGALIEKHANELMESNHTEGYKASTEYTSKMIRNLKEKQPEKVKQIYEKIVKEGMEGFIRREVEDVINGGHKVVTVRRKRIEEDIEKLTEKGKMEDIVKEGYIRRLLYEIELPKKASQDLLKRRITIEHPNATPEEREKLAQEKSYLRLETFEECYEKLRTAIYIGEASNSYVLKLFESENILTADQIKQLRYASGGSTENTAIETTQKNTREAVEKLGKISKEDER